MSACTDTATCSWVWRSLIVKMPHMCMIRCNHHLIPTGQSAFGYGRRSNREVCDQRIVGRDSAAQHPQALRWRGRSSWRRDGRAFSAAAAATPMLEEGTPDSFLGIGLVSAFEYDIIRKNGCFVSVFYQRCVNIGGLRWSCRKRSFCFSGFVADTLHHPLSTRTGCFEYGIQISASLPVVVKHGWPRVNERGVAAHMNVPCLRAGAY